MTRDAQEEARLLALAKAGDAGATERLLAPYQPLLLSLARRFQGMPQGELCQAGYVGLMEALRRYNGAQGARFVTYAVPWALGEMRRALRSATDSTGAMARRAQIARRQQALLPRWGANRGWMNWRKPAG